MADYLIETISNESLEQINKLVERITNGIDGVVKMNREFKNMKLPSDVSNGIENVAKETKKSNKTVGDAINLQKKLEVEQRKRIALEKKLGRQISKLQKQLDKYNKSSDTEQKQIKAKIPTLRQLASLRKQAEAALKREQREIEKTSGLYNRIQNGIKSVTKEYNDLAIKKELNGRLDAGEAIQLGKLEYKLNKYQRALKNVDARIGKHQRNVGNYKSAFDGLGFSVAQLSRELPAFANSMQTGFMAISNNIPMLVDEITRLKKANVELAASGKPTVNILKRVGSAIFSLQGLLGVGITLLTVFGPKLIEWATGMNEAEKATEEATEDLKEQNKQLRENLKLRGQQISGEQQIISDPDRLRELTTTEAGLVELAERLKNINVQGVEVLKDENLLLEDRKRLGLNLIKIAKLQNQAELVRNRQTEIENERLQIEKDFQDGKISAKLKEIKINKILTDNETFGFTRSIEIQNEINRILKDNESLMKNKVELVYEEKDETDEILEKRKAEKAILEEIIQLKKDADADAEFRAQFGAGINELDNDTIIGGITTPSDKEMIDALNLSLAENAELIKEIEKAQSDLAKQEILFEAFNRLEATLGIQAGTFQTIFEGIVDGFDSAEEAAQAFGEVAIGAFNNIMKVSNAKLENERRNLEIEERIAVEFAGDSAAAREEIEERFSERQKEIRLKQAKNERAQALFNIGIGTAQGIIKTIANVGFPGAIPLIAIIGALGLAQAATVAATPLPQFKDGVRNFEGGWAILGDGGVAEYARTPDGKIHKTPDTDTLYNLPKGTDVYKNEDELNRVLGANGINPIGSAIHGRGMAPNIKIENSSGISASEMERIMNKTLAKQAKKVTHYDKHGFNHYIQNGHTRKNILNNQVTFKGIEV